MARATAIASLYSGAVMHVQHINCITGYLEGLKAAEVLQSPAMVAKVWLRRQRIFAEV
jgi:hypothetical protein